MSIHGDSDVDATEEINVDDSDSASCSPRNYANDSRRLDHSECSDSPPPSQTNSRTLQNESPRSHPFSISRLLGESRPQNPKSPSSEDPDAEDKERKWSWEEGNNNGGSSAALDDGRRSWGHEMEEKLSEKDDDDTGSTAETQTNSLHCASATDLLAPFRLFPTGSGLIYTGGGVIRVPAHRPPGANGAATGALPAQALIPPWSLQALQHSQQQAAAAGLHRASLLANLAAHPLQGHPHLKDRLAGKREANSRGVAPDSLPIFIPTFVTNKVTRVLISIAWKSVNFPFPFSVRSCRVTGSLRFKMRILNDLDAIPRRDVNNPEKRKLALKFQRI